MFVTNNIYKGTEEWAQSYLTTKSSRLTSILKQDCANEYQAYFDIINRYFDNGDMIYRAKIINNDSLNIQEYWSSRAFVKYFDELKANTTMQQSMEQQGFKVTVDFSRDRDFETFLRTVLAENTGNIVIQFLQEKYLFILEEFGITLGDPLKTGLPVDQW